MFHLNTERIACTSLFSSENILVFEQTQKPGEIFSELLKNLALTFGIGNVKHIISDFMRRNGHRPLQVINNCALVQHFRLSSTENLRIAIGYVKEGVDYRTEKLNGKIHFFFLIVSPKKRPDLYLRMLRSLDQLMQDTVMKDEIIKNPDPVNIFTLLEKKGSEIPLYAIVADIMQQPAITIREENNLEEAVDIFTRTGSLYIPVIDKDGDLIGEVTLQELMRVCLPRYILWMDDINPILNFEPFRNMLYNEGNTWLEEIMTHDIAIVHPEDPAIKAGIGMTKLSVDHAYVLEDKKLAGIITLQQFVYKVLRE